jgi:hypothetical protein
MISEIGKRIYNYYLRAYRVNNGKPYRAKINFDGFEKKEDFLYVQRLELFFKKFPHLLKYDFFNAPYQLYRDDEKWFSLKYYSSYKGLRTCLDYYQSLLKNTPDDQIDFLRESMKFIAEFCIEKNISVQEYPFYKSVTQHDFLKHLKEHRISWYMVFGIPGMLDHLHKMDPDEFELYFGDSINLGELQFKYSTSPKGKEIIEKGMKKMSEIVAKTLKINSKSGNLG